MALFASRGKLLRCAPLLALPLLLCGCGATIHEAYMAKDGAGTLKATSFHSEGDQIHCIVDFRGGDEESVLTFDLSGPDALQMTDEEVYPRPSSDKQGPIKVDVQLFVRDALGERADEGPWPLGDYTMAISLDGELEEELDFDVVP
jgi:hypothetical protein